MSDDVSLNWDEIDILARLIPGEPDHYTVLGVDRDASLETINAAYSIAVEYFHPLKRQDMIRADAVMQYRLSRAILRLEEAFMTLSSPRRRKTYDDKLNNRHLTPLPRTDPAAAIISLSHTEKSTSLNHLHTPGGLEVTRLREVAKEQDRRRVERSQIRLPALVTFEHQWQEITETKDVSPLGSRLCLSHQVEPGTLLQVELPMPHLLRTHSYGEKAYTTKAYVLYTLRQKGENLVAVEFI